MLCIVEHYDRAPYPFKLIEVDLVQEIFLLEISVGDPWILPHQRQDKLDIDG